MGGLLDPDLAGVGAWSEHRPAVIRISLTRLATSVVSESITWTMRTRPTRCHAGTRASTKWTCEFIEAPVHSTELYAKRLDATRYCASACFVAMTRYIVRRSDVAHDSLPLAFASGCVHRPNYDSREKLAIQVHKATEFAMNFGDA